MTSGPERPWRSGARALPGGHAAAVLLGVVLAALPLRGDGPSALERPAADLLLRVAPAPAPSGRVVLVALDDRSLSELGERWPLSRTTWARFLQALSRHRPGAVAVDVLFDQPADREALDLGEEVLQRLGPEPEDARVWLEERLRALDGDSLLAEALAESGTVVLGSTAVLEGPDARTSLAPTHVSGEPLASGPLRLRAPEVLEGAAALRMSARSGGTLNMLVDADGIIRRYPIAVDVRGRLYPSLALAAARVLEPGRAGALRDAALAADGAAPVVRFPAAGWLPRVSFVDVLHEVEGSALSSALQGRLVLVGATAAGLHDQRTVPGEVAVPGVEIHAAAADNLLAGGLVTTGGRFAWLGLGATAVGLLALAAACLVLRRWSVAWVPVAGAVLLAAYGGLALGVLRAGGLLALMPVTLGAVGLVGVECAARARRIHQQRGQLRALFSDYVDPAVVDDLLRHPEKVELGGGVQELSVLFVDLRHFTALSEGLAPAELLGFLNRYLSAMTDVLQQEGAYLDKYMGDGIMAVFCTPVPRPDHALRAVRAALRMVEVAASLGLEVGVGINSGPVVVGSVGAAHGRKGWTVVGDVVNVASRIEGMNKPLGTRILVGERTAALVGASVRLRPLGDTVIRGRSAPVPLFEVRGLASAGEAASAT